MNIDEWKNDILEYIQYSHDDTSLELEAILKPTYNEPITFDDYIRLLKRLKAKKVKVKKTETLDIIYEWKPGSQSNIRISINGSSNIKKYCLTNNILDIDEKHIKFLKKNRVKVIQEIDGNEEEIFLKPININSYNIRLNLKSENYISRNHQQVKDILDVKTWHNKRKFFRYKQRYSYFVDKNFVFDITVVKSSEIKIVETGVKKTTKLVYSKTLQESNVLNQDPNYEIELEYIGNKNKIKLEITEVLKEMFKHIGFILQSHQKSYFLSTKEDRKMLRDAYTELLKTKKFKGFQGPNSITIEPKHIQKRGYLEYNENLVNIRRNYSVTDKADGERNELVILDDGKMFMINRKNFIRYLGASCNYTNIIIDGEYISKDKNGNNLNLFMAFDIYILEGTIVHNKIFQRTSDEIMYNTKEKSRYEILLDFEKGLELDLLPNNNLEFLVKKFYFGNNEKFDEGINRQISDLELSLLTAPEEDIVRLRDQINILYSDSDIFKKAKFIYDKEYIYNIDGLIFTPCNLKVGENIITNETRFNGRWFMNFKWKPPEENTIDFLVYFEKDSDNYKKDLISYINKSDRLQPCKTAILYVGYDPNIHTKYNACRVLNENLTFKSGYFPTKFYPTNPYNRHVNMCKILLKNDVAKCEDNSIITDGSIVEFRYNPDSDSNFPWIPMRTRDINAPNDYLTASNVWTSINDPVTKKMIIGDEIIGTIPDSDVYYSNTKKRDMLLTKPMNDFHSYIKKSLIRNNTNPNTNLIDLSCGRLGDLNHWVDSNISSVVAIDIMKDNFDNINNGACIRILNQQTENNSHPLLNNILLIWADSSKKFLTGDSGNDELNKYYLNIVYGKITKSSINSKKLKLFSGIGKNGFDTASCQFSIHYFFKTELTLNNFLENVSNSLKVDGKFIVTCIDGRELFTRLNINPILEGQIDSTLVWKIVKKYDNVSLEDNANCLGMEVDIYVESINQTITEYLVNIDYLAIKARKYNLEIVERKNFKDIYDTISSSTIDYGDINKLISDSKYDILKDYSFLNMSLVFKKI